MADLTLEQLKFGALLDLRTEPRHCNSSHAPCYLAKPLPMPWGKVPCTVIQVSASLIAGRDLFGTEDTRTISLPFQGWMQCNTCSGQSQGGEQLPNKFLIHDLYWIDSSIHFSSLLQILLLSCHPLSLQGLSCHFTLHCEAGPTLIFRCCPGHDVPNKQRGLQEGRGKCRNIDFLILVALISF